MPWVLLLLAGLFEIAWVTGLKFAEGFTRPWITAGTVMALAASVILLGLAAKSLPLATAYAVWTGIGAAGAVICGIFLFGDPVSTMKLVCTGLIIAGVLGLKMA